MPRGEDTRDHPGRRVDHHTARAGTPYERTYRHALSAVSTNDDGSEARQVIGLSDSRNDAELYKSMVGVQRYPDSNERYEYTEREN